MRRGMSVVETTVGAFFAIVLVVGIGAVVRPHLPATSVKPNPPTPTAEDRRHLWESLHETPESLAAAFDEPSAMDRYRGRQIELRGTLSRVEEGAVEFATDGKIIRVLLTSSVPNNTTRYKPGMGARVAALLSDVKEDCLTLDHGVLIEGDGGSL